jgi:hypothetical protein
MKLILFLLLLICQAFAISDDKKLEELDKIIEDFENSFETTYLECKGSGSILIKYPTDQSFKPIYLKGERIIASISYNKDSKKTTLNLDSESNIPGTNTFNGIDCDVSDSLYTCASYHNEAMVKGKIGKTGHPYLLDGHYKKEFSATINRKTGHLNYRGKFDLLNEDAAIQKIESVYGSFDCKKLEENKF